MEKLNQVLVSEETKIIAAAQLRYEQAQFPSREPSSNYKVGYLQGYYDAIKHLKEAGIVEIACDSGNMH